MSTLTPPAAAPGQDGTSRQRSTRRHRLHRSIYLTSGAHFVVDGYGNIYAPLLPLLIPRLNLSLAAAGALAMCFQLAASVSQLAFGQLADRWRPRLLLMAGPVVAVVVLSLVGIATTPLALAAILLVGGLGCAAFHPPGAVVAHRLGGSHPGLAMSTYISGGSLGFSVAPLIFAPAAQRFGLQWTPAFALPGLLVLAVFLAQAPAVPPHPGGDRQGLRALRPYARPLTLLYLIVVLRTMTSLAFATFLPVMLTRRGLSVGQAGAAVALFLFASGVGGFAGGPAADRFGARRVIVLSLIAAAPLLALAPLLSGWAFLAALAAGGLFLQSTLPVNVALAQALAPVSTATVSSLMMGFAWGTGGLTVPFVGMLADRIGIERTLVLLAAMPVIAAFCAWPLPGGRSARAPAQPADIGIPEAGAFSEHPGETEDSPAPLQAK